jgi:hypothetical protein
MAEMVPELDSPFHPTLADRPVKLIASPAARAFVRLVEATFTPAGATYNVALASLFSITRSTRSGLGPMIVVPFTVVSMDTAVVDAIKDS